MLKIRNLDTCQEGWILEQQYQDATLNPRLAVFVMQDFRDNSFKVEYWPLDRTKCTTEILCEPTPRGLPFNILK